ncbi:MAG: NUDIX domain-containing protein [Pseudomonadota bacterium]|nr:NUDIX domain-containing protein [Pseudomonadota bacterium]
MRRRSLLSRGFHAALMLRRSLTLGVRGLIEDADGAVLLVRHTYVKGWHFPGGGVDPGETVAEALAREVAEETALRLTTPPELLGVYLNRRLGSRDHVMFFRCRDWERKSAFSPDLEIADARFFPRDALPHDLSRGTKRRFDELDGTAAISSEW